MTVMKNMAYLIAVFGVITLLFSFGSCQNVSVWLADSPGQLVYQVINVGANYSVQCKAHPPDAEISWLKVPSLERITTKKAQERVYTKRASNRIVSLKIDNVEKQDGGVYKCIAEYNGKNDSSLLNVTVYDSNFCGFEWGMCGFWDAKGSHLDMTEINTQNLVGFVGGSGQVVQPGRPRLTGPSYDVTLGPQYHNGHYIYLPSGTKEVQRYAMLVSFLFNATQTERCFSFWYHAWGPDVDRVAVSRLNDGKKVVDRTTLKAVTDFEGNVWKEFQVAVPPVNSAYNLIIELEKKAGGDIGDIAIDDIRWFDAPCNVTDVPDLWNQLKTPIRLVNGTKSKEGRVEIRHEGEWGTIAGATGDTDAGVICKALGYGEKKSTLKQHGFYGGAENLRVWVGSLNCSGTERDPMACRVGSFDEAKYYDHSRDIGVVCLDECVDQPCGLHGECSNVASGYDCSCNFGYTGSDCGTKQTNSSLRLVDTGKDDDSKRVEVEFKGRWQTLCPIIWQNTEAQVVCGMQGLNTSTATPISGRVSGEVTINTTKWTVHCSGNEEDIVDCTVIPSPPDYECDGRYVGVICNDFCASNPCLSGGTCKNTESGFNCTCPSDIFGERCDQDGVDDCAGDPCKNGGTCLDGVKEYTCSCPIGKTGKNCEDEVNFCEPNPCKNGKACQGFSTGFKCDCQENWQGKDCSEDVDECLHIREPCPENATCVNLAGSFQCLCPTEVDHKDCTNTTDVYKNCPPLPDIAHGKVMRYPTMLKYSCENGYLLDGIPSRECGPRGSWIPSNESPQCIPNGEQDITKFSPKVFTLTRFWKGQYVYRAASFEFFFSVTSVNESFFGNITGDFHDKLSSRIVLTGTSYPPNRIKLKLLKKSGAPRFDQPDWVLEGNLTYVNKEWRCLGQMTGSGFGHFYMVPASSGTEIQLPEDKFTTPKNASSPKSSKKTVAIVLPILFLLLAVTVCAVVYVLFRNGRYRNRYQGATRFENPMYEQ